ncbi:MAG: hypothetical protein NC427_07115 [Ruminococcus flavefaciens]|nr:hypothetical protein [Ruminococcus flavefaciens]
MEVGSYFHNKYLELKQNAHTYGELEEAIKREASAASFTDSTWGHFMYAQLMEMLHKEWNGLPIQ